MRLETEPVFDFLKRKLSVVAANKRRRIAQKKQQILIFTHIAKCGGTTLRQLFFEAARDIPRAAVFVPGISPVSFLAEVGDLSLAEQKRLVLIAAHVAFGVHEYLEIWKPVYYTMLREPVSRTISHYYFKLYPKTRKHLSELSVSERRTLLPEVSNTMTKCLRGSGTWKKEWDTDTHQMFCFQEQALGNLMNQYRGFGLLEDMPASISRMKDQFPWLNFNLPAPLKLNASVVPGYASLEVSEEIRAAVAAANEPDLALYAKAKAVFYGGERSA